MKSSRPLLIAACLVAAPLGLHAYQPTAAEAAFPDAVPIAPGKFQPTWESLGHYETPEWFRDAKFGIWAHWGPQCQPEQGDWFAKHMYDQGKVDENGTFKPNPRYDWMVKTYGPLTEFGFKDVINSWKAEQWDPAKLMALYKRAGAKYFMALANHHDNFDLWDSKYQPWNSVAIGPKKDLIGGWEKAARAEGLRFGVSVHAGHTWSWYETAQSSDSHGPRQGQPYDGKLTLADGKGKWWDGLDPQDLYAQNHPVSRADWEWRVKPPATGADDPRLPSPPHITKFFNRTIDLLDRYQPDLVYFDDSVLPFYPISDVGLKIAAHFYNSNLDRNGGRLEAVINGKKLDEIQKKALVYDIERGKAEGILPLPWQTDTCIGQWHYSRDVFNRHAYKKSVEVINMLADIVSKNGNLMLSIPVRGDGSLDEDELQLLDEIAAWMDVNAEAIFATRPWKVFGEGPSLHATHEKGQYGGVQDVTRYTAGDVRYTRSKDGRILYAILMAWPESGAITLTALKGENAVASVSLLGAAAAPEWKATEEGLRVTLPAANPGKAAAVLKITGNSPFALAGLPVAAP